MLKLGRIPRPHSQVQAQIEINGFAYGPRHLSVLWSKRNHRLERLHLAADLSDEAAEIAKTSVQEQR